MKAALENPVVATLEIIKGRRVGGVFDSDGLLIEGDRVTDNGPRDAHKTEYSLVFQRRRRLPLQADAGERSES